MEHLTSFSLGTGMGLAIAFLSGFVKRAGEHLYDLLRKKVSPPAPDSVEVDGTFEPDLQYYGRCAWISESKLAQILNKGYTYYKYNDDGSKCFRYTSSARNHKEFLMHQPHSTQATHT